MTNTQHTPGPWEVTVDGWGGGELHLSVFIPDKTQDLEEAFQAAEANARLIAASPEILGALLNTADALDQLMREGAVKPGHPYAPHVRDLIDNARAAIAKAAGA